MEDNKRGSNKRKRNLGQGGMKKRREKAGGKVMSQNVGRKQRQKVGKGRKISQKGSKVDNKKAERRASKRGRGGEKKGRQDRGKRSKRRSEKKKARRGRRRGGNRRRGNRRRKGKGGNRKRGKTKRRKKKRRMSVNRGNESEGGEARRDAISPDQDDVYTKYAGRTNCVYLYCNLQHWLKKELA